MTYGPPKPIRLDGIVFFNDRQEHESAYKYGCRVGEFEIDDIYNHWRARKLNADSELGSWRPMRHRPCAAIAVHKNRRPVR